MSVGTRFDEGSEEGSDGFGEGVLEERGVTD